MNICRIAPKTCYCLTPRVPLIKAEPEDLDETDFDPPLHPLDHVPAAARHRKQTRFHKVKQEEKENTAPTNSPLLPKNEQERQVDEEEEEEGDWEEYGPDVSLPSHPRPPPPKPKGRPHRIRDNCCQTVSHWVLHFDLFLDKRLERGHLNEKLVGEMIQILKNPLYRLKGKIYLVCISV